MTLDYDAFDALTFDCYGTLIDWEAGIVDGLRAALGRRAADSSDDGLLQRYAKIEAALEAGPYRTYRDILATCGRDIAAELGMDVDPTAIDRFADSVGEWPAFPDSTDALERLHRRFRLGVITNCDDDLFARSAERLRTRFDVVVTAQQVGAYKPDPRGFGLAFERLAIPTTRVLHVAQSLYHDHVPAKRLGLTTVWIDRRHGRPGSGATPPAEAAPDATYHDMTSFADAATA
jgi:2-haloacid dehalogenase